MYREFVDGMRKTALGRGVIALLWPIKRRAQFFFGWVLGGRRRRLGMRDSENYVQGLLDLIAELPMVEGGLTMVEIGSYRGESAQLFLDSGKISRIFCVDPWKPFYDKNDEAAFTDMAKVEGEFDARFASEPRVVKAKGTIDDFAAKYAADPAVQGRVDFVYVDGCHTREATAHDIEVALGQVKPRVAIAGHDYLEGVDDGVKAAVDGRFGQPDKVFVDTSWLKSLR